jgi:hypothetical protein
MTETILMAGAVILVSITSSIAVAMWFDRRNRGRDNEKSRRQAAELIAAVGPFRTHLAWMYALQELGEITIRGDHDIVHQISGSGGHSALTIEHFKRLDDMARKWTSEQFTAEEESQPGHWE